MSNKQDLAYTAHQHVIRAREALFGGRIGAAKYHITCNKHQTVFIWLSILYILQSMIGVTMLSGLRRVLI